MTPARMKYRFLVLLLIVFFNMDIKGQEVWQHLSNRNIYDFMDELANAGIMDVNSAVKPYSRMFIAKALVAARENKDRLTARQRKEADFYLLEYKLEADSLPDYKTRFDLFGKNEHLATALNPLGLFYKDKLFTFSLKPIWGINYFFREGESIYHRWGGAETFATIGKHWGLYASLRDNNETENISGPGYFTLRPGGAYKGLDYSEMRGGVTYAWKWGSFGVVKDHVNWGNHEHGPMIFSDRPPSFAQIQLKIKPAKWFEMNYFHGWLVSMEIDSSRSYFYTDPPREVYRPKYIAANLFTFTPWKRLNLSIGNSIIYSDMGVQLAYLIPVLFYKSVDHTLNQGIDNQNSQMYFDVSSRNIRNLHLYGTFFIDELKFDRISDPDTYNFWSAKVGAKTTNLAVKNLSFTLEYSISVPITYEHRVPTLTFESNYYHMGYYLQDNSQEIYAAVTYKPVRGLHLRAYFMLAQHGPDYPYDVNDPNQSVDEHPFMERVTWENETFSLKASYEFINNAYLFAEYIHSDISGDEEKVIQYTPEFFRGNATILSAGFNFGF